jgi:hypothetical protein
MIADTANNARERHIEAYEAQSLFVASGADKRHVTNSIHTAWARVLTWRESERLANSRRAVFVTYVGYILVPEVTDS